MKRKDGTATSKPKSAAPKASRKALSRRRFLGMAGTSAAALTTAELINCKATWASDAPETPDVRFGIIALTDNSPIVIAHEKGFFKKYGINSTVAKGANWAAIRDSLSNGDNQATHMLIGMPIASTMGLLGSPKKPMVIPWLLNRNGQSITPEGRAEGQGRRRSQGAEAAGDGRQGQGLAHDLRHDLPARAPTPCGCATGWAPAASTPTRTSP